MTKFKFSDYTRPGERICISKSVYLEGELVEHTHDFIELVYISGGSGIHVVNGEKRVVRQGDLLIVGDHSIHTFYPSVDNFTWINCFFLPDILQSLYESHPSNQVTLSLLAGCTSDMGRRTSLNDWVFPKLPPEVGKLFETMFKEYNHCGPHYQSVLEMYLHILFLKLAPHVSHPEYPTSFPYALTDDLETVVSSFFGQATSFENIRTAHIASAMYMTPKHLSNLFKKKTGKNLSDFIKNIKLERACLLLRNSRMNVQDIITLVGYNDSKYFYTIFKEFTNMTPGEYRRSFAVNKEE